MTLPELLAIFDRCERDRQPITPSMWDALLSLARKEADPQTGAAAAERAAIVADLRDRASEMVKLNQHDDVRLRGAAYLNTARDIERLTHWSPK